MAGAGGDTDDYVFFGDALPPLEEGKHFCIVYIFSRVFDDVFCLWEAMMFNTIIYLLFSDEIAGKKPIRIEDQEVRDEHGRRRFHGAFTGGFSAGYYNTVDTKEGWRPAEFKSSRADRQKRQQKPEDYMDDEDLGSFGIAPQVLRAKDEFGDNQISRRQTRPLFATGGAIPGK